MSKSEDPQDDRSGNESESDSRQNWVAVIVLFISAVLWALAIYVTYVLTPKTEGLIGDFGIRVSSVTGPAIWYAGDTLLILAAVGALVAWRTRSRFARSFTMLWLPLAFAAGFFSLHLMIVYKISSSMSG